MQHFELIFMADATRALTQPRRVTWYLYTHELLGRFACPDLQGTTASLQNIGAPYSHVFSLGTTTIIRCHMITHLRRLGSAFAALLGEAWRWIRAS